MSEANRQRVLRVKCGRGGDDFPRMPDDCKTTRDDMIGVEVSESTLGTHKACVESAESMFKRTLQTLRLRRELDHAGFEMRLCVIELLSAKRKTLRTAPVQCRPGLRKSGLHRAQSFVSANQTLLR